MDALLPSDPRALSRALDQEIEARLGPRAKPRRLLDRLRDSVAEGAAAMSPAAVPLDPKALAALAAQMGKDLDQLEDQLEALALYAGPAGGG